MPDGLAAAGQHSLSAQSQDPAHALGARVFDYQGRILRYARVGSAFTKGQLAAPQVTFDITSGITAAANSRTFADSAAGFTKRVTDINGKVTTWENPAIGSILHVHGDTGKQQFARVTNVLSTSLLGVDVIDRADHTWGTALASTANVRIISPVVVPYDNSSHSQPPYGVALGVSAAGDFAFFGCEGLFDCDVNSIVIGAKMITGTTAGQLEPLEMRGTATWDPGSIADGNEEAQEITVTGAALGDFVQVSFSLDITDLVLNGAVTAADTVTAILANNTGGAIDLASGTVAALVNKRIIPYYEVGDLISPPDTATEKGLVMVNLGSNIHGNWYM